MSFRQRADADTETGQTVYLPDEALKLPPRQRVAPELAAVLVELGFWVPLTVRLAMRLPDSLGKGRSATKGGGRDTQRAVQFGLVRLLYFSLARLKALPKPVLT